MSAASLHGNLTRLGGASGDRRTGTARRLRREATREERLLWAALRGLDLPAGHFRRQAPIGPFYADFAHHGMRLVIELDGGQHGHDEHAERDRIRTAYLEAAGYRVLRFWNHDVRENLDGVVETILTVVAEQAAVLPLRAAHRRKSLSSREAAPSPREAAGRDSERAEPASKGGGRW